MADQEGAERVRKAIGDLEAVRDQLRDIQAGLPPEEGSEIDEAGMRSVIECVIQDSINPAIRDLRAALLEGGGGE